MSGAPRRRWSLQLRRLNAVTHRDLGYFASSLVIAYCLSGLALNHVDVWNPDFIVKKRVVSVPRKARAADVTAKDVEAYGALVGESGHRVWDAPTPDQIKIYYADATLHVDLAAGTGRYEKVARRPLFYQVDVLHRNSWKPWRWAADAFALVLVAINVTGLFVLRGRQGLGGRGKWLVLAGAVPPAIALVLHG